MPAPALGVSRVPLAPLLVAEIRAFAAGEREARERVGLGEVLLRPLDVLRQTVIIPGRLVPRKGLAKRRNHGNERLMTPVRLLEFKQGVAPVPVGTGADAERFRSLASLRLLYFTQPPRLCSSDGIVAHLLDALERAEELI